MHTFVIVFEHEIADPVEAEQLTSAALDYAIHHKGGLPRGLQTGTLTLPVLLMAEPSPELVVWAEQQPISRFGAVLLPVLADTKSHRTYWYKERLAKGYYFQSDMHAVIEQIITPGIEPRA